MSIAYDMGDADLLRSHARRHLEALIAAPEALASQLQRLARLHTPAETPDREGAATALRAFQQCLNGTDLTPFLAFGTLLGAIRDQGIIAGDNDIDMAVFGTGELRQLRRIMQRSVFAIVGNPRTSILKLRHPNGWPIDVYCFEPLADGTLAWQVGTRIAFTMKFPRQFGLSQIAFLGTAVSIPDCAEDYLEWCYGPTWTTPDSYYHDVTSGPLRGHAHADYAATVGPLSIVRTLRDGQMTKGLAMTQSMAGLFPEDDLWPRFADALNQAGITMR